MWYFCMFDKYRTEEKMAAIRNVCAVGFFLFLVIAFMTDGPIPFFDQGHRTFGVCSEQALQRVVEVISQTSDLKLKQVFEYGPTVQAEFTDKKTVVNWLRDSRCRATLGAPTGDAISLVAEDPKAAAEKAAQMFESAGYESRVEKVTDVLYLCRTTALNSADLVYRRHALKMGGKPKTRPLFQ
jgi:hypothetical protein